MTKAQDYVSQLKAILSLLETELSAVTPTTNLIATAADLTAACQAGGAYTLAPNIYQGNFVVNKPITLIGTADSILQPVDPLLPTLSVQAGKSTFKGFKVKNGAPDRECVTVGNFFATDAAIQPDGVTFDGVSIEAGAKGGHRGIGLHGSNITVNNCRVTNFWEIGRDAQAIWIHNGPGPYNITNNYLEGSGEVILVGGETIKIPNCVPSDVLISGNTCFKPDTWRTDGASVKNSIELKACRRARIENNLIDGNWRGGQDGTPILLTTRNQNNDTPWVVVDDVIVRGNKVNRCADGFAVSILGLDDNYTSQQMQTVVIEHNLFLDSPNGFKIGNGVATSLRIANNTLPKITNNFMQFYSTKTPFVLSPLTFVENVLRQGAYGIAGDGTGVGNATLAAYTKLVSFIGNIIEKNPERAVPIPAGNTLVEIGALLGLLDSQTFKLLNGTAGY